SGSPAVHSASIRATSSEPSWIMPGAISGDDTADRSAQAAGGWRQCRTSLCLYVVVSSCRRTNSRRFRPNGGYRCPCRRPEMPLHSSSWPRVREVFEAALALPSDERSAYVAASCEDPGLRVEVERMLASHEHAGTFLEHPALLIDTEGTTDFEGR